MNSTQNQIWASHYCFFNTLARYQHQPEALTVLGLTGSENKKEKQARYRQLVQQHHPDKGGDPEQFRRIQNAWQSIKKMR
ncbi:MAG: J domain-containing protein [Reinekea sp.]